MSKRSFLSIYGAVIALVLAALQMRAPVSAVGPIAGALTQSLDIGYGAYGLLSALPVVCFGLFSFIVPKASRRFGLAPIALAALIAISIGAFFRVIPSIWTVLLGTAVIGAGIAVLNVAMPVVVKAWFPEKVAGMMGIYTSAVGLSGALGAFLSVPLLHAFDTWRAPLFLWCITAVLASCLWFFTSPKRTMPQSVTALKSKSLWRSPLAWAIMIVMGLQSLLVYTVGAWLPTILETRGLSDAAAGFWAAIFLTVGMPASMLMAPFMRWIESEIAAALFLALLYLLGVFCWLMGGDWMRWGCVFAGVSQGAMFSLAFLLMSSKTANLIEMIALSSMAQGAGYIIAGAGPLLFGLLYQGDGDWTLPFVFLGAVLIVWALAGIYSGCHKSMTHTRS